MRRGDHQYTQTRGSEAVLCRTDDRSHISACHWRRDAAATHACQLDRAGLLYTVETGSDPRPTLTPNRTALGGVLTFNFRDYSSCLHVFL